MLMPSDCIGQKGRIDRIAPFRLSGAAVILRAVVAIAGTLPFAASPARAANAEEPPAFQGHGAEMQMRDEADDARRRALYFDGVAIELGPLGLPCDHLVKRRPQAAAGTGYVVLLSLNAGGAGRRARVWIPPGGAASLAQARRQARDSVLERARGATIAELDAKEFIWCR
jgi:hypothetical protein